MPDAIQPVGAMVQPPNPQQGLGLMSSILDVQQKRQSLEQQNLDIQSRQQDLQRSQIETQQAQGVNSFFGSFDMGDRGNHDDAGLVDIDAAHDSPQYKALPGVAKLAVDTKLNQLRSQQLAVKQNLATLNGDVVGQFGKLAQSLKGKPPELQQQLLASFSQQGPDQKRIGDLYGPVYKNAPADKKDGVLDTMGAQALDVASQYSQQNPQVTPISTGGETKLYNVSKGTGVTPGQQPVASVKNTIPPGYMLAPNGSIVRADNSGLSSPPTTAAPGQPQTSGQPRTAAQDAPPPNAPRAVQEAYGAATKSANDHVESVRTADEGYGNNKAIANAVRTLSAGANTGPGTETWNHVMGVLGTKGANNYQELGAFLDRQAATVRGQMGIPGTNAGAEDAKMIAGNTGYNAKVIQDKNNYTEAMTDGLHMYRNGIDRIAGFSGQASPQQVSKFKSAWTNVFDPNVLIGENAYKRSKADGDAFVKSLNPQEAASLSAKRKAMQALSQGQLQ